MGLWLFLNEKKTTNGPLGAPVIFLSYTIIHFENFLGPKVICIVFGQIWPPAKRYLEKNFLRLRRVNPLPLLFLPRLYTVRFNSELKLHLIYESLNHGSWAIARTKRRQVWLLLCLICLNKGFIVPFSLT